MNKQIIVAFDFDGTLTNKDTFGEFIKFTHSRISYICGALICIPLIIAYKLNIIPNYTAKQKIFSYFYKGMKYEKFLSYGQRFADKINKFVRTDTLLKLKEHKEEGHKIYVISAGGIEWIECWCKRNGVDKVIATLSERDDKDCLTGRFLSKNCYGEEKVRRFLEEEPSRDNYILYAYGDSKGDEPLINFADYGQMV
ncbi:MAG: HAD-IB family hydrolase [Bacteroidales bacterium]